MKNVVSKTFAPMLSQRMGQRVTKKSKKEFAELLKDWRKRQGLSQSQAAKRLGVPIKTLQNWEIARTRPVPYALRELTAKLK